jgi:hypothetical protein
MVPRSDGADLETVLGGIGEAFKDNNFRRYSLGSIISWLSFFVQAVTVPAGHRDASGNRSDHRWAMHWLPLCGKCSCFRPKNVKQGG